MALERKTSDTLKGGHRTGHEIKDADVRWIFWLVLFLFLSALALQGVLAGYLKKLKSGPAPTDAWRPVERVGQTAATNAPFPRLQVSPPLDLQAFRAREEAELSTYGWLNRTAGIVRLPIERAMELVLQEGLPTRRGTNQNVAGPSSYELIRERGEHREEEIRP